MSHSYSGWYREVVEVTRGNIVESVHYGAIAVVDSHGKLVASYGDPNAVSFLRSSAKPFQALPFIEMGGGEKYGFTSAEIGLICASHSGTEEHRATLEKLQAKIGISESDLLCGIHYPLYKPAADALMMKGHQPTQNNHNCSGKHTGMLAHAKMRGAPLNNYLDIDHPIQQSILKTFSEMCDYPQDKVEIGVDGCSAPVFAIPLYNAALGLARLSDPWDLGEARAKACKKIFDGMTGAPFLVAGPERFDTDFMDLMGNRALTKTGAEGYQVFGIPARDGKPGMGIALKIADGDVTERSRSLVGLEVLRQIGVITENDLEKLGNYYTRKIYNWRHLEVGQMRPCFTLDF
jgi:L-asparaginase II